MSFFTQKDGESMMSDCELEDLVEYLADVKEKLTERGLEFNRLHWISRWKQDTEWYGPNTSEQSFWRSND